LNRHDAITTILGPTLLTMPFTYFVAMAVSSRPGALLNRLLVGRTLTALGRYSYGLYVYHFILTVVFDRWLPAELFRGFIPVPVVPIVLRVGVCGLLSLGVAYASWTLFETRFLALKRLFPYHRSPVVVGSQDRSQAR
jgi:peptidoglycan/LPS O-acetylase OafA/YrhL